MKQVVCVGAGGIGNWLLRGLTPMLEHRAPGSVLMIVDGDTFEEKNRERQDFSEFGEKATVRAGMLQPMYPQTIVIARPAWVVQSIPDGTEDADAFIPVKDVCVEGGLVLVAVDNHATRKLIIDEAKNRDDIDVIMGGNDDGFYGDYVHYRRRGGVEVIEDPQEFHPDMANPTDRNPAELSCEERQKLPSGSQLVATNMGVAAFMLARAHQVLFEEDPGTEASEVRFDLRLGRSAPYDRAPQKS